MRIAIIGAGPAGAIAAFRLARDGASVLLFDASHPREKPCGGGLTGRALALLSGVVDIAALAPVIVESAIVEGADNATADAEVSLIDRGATPASSLVVLSRAAFDGALTAMSVSVGARLIQEKVVDVLRRGCAMAIRTDRNEYDADYVLGADGANSVVRKKLATPFTRAQLSIAAGYFVEGVTASTIVLKTMSGEPGYLWSFPRHDHLAVGICAPAGGKVTSAHARAQSLAWIEHHGLHTTTTLKPYAWPIPTAGFEDARRMTCSGTGWMLLGDAAGLVDPLTREGIYYALLSGQWAADALRSGSASRAAELYAERLRTDVHPELARAARLSRLFFGPMFSRLFVDALRESPPIREVFVDLVGGVQPYGGLRRRLLATREWKLAARAIRLALTPAFAGTMKPVALSHETQ